MGRGWSDCGAREADVNAPNDAGRKDNKHVDTKNPSDGEKVRGTMARIAASKHLATLHSVKGGIYLRIGTSAPSKDCIAGRGLSLEASTCQQIPINAACMQAASLHWQRTHGVGRRDKSSPRWPRRGTELAAEAESDQTLLQAISEMELGGPDDDLPHALKLRLGEYA